MLNLTLHVRPHCARLPNVATRAAWLVIVFGTVGSVFAQTPAEIENRIRALLARMSIEEKLGQMSQAAFPQGLPERTREEIRRGRWGSFFNAGTPREKKFFAPARPQAAKIIG